MGFTFRGKTANGTPVSSDRVYGYGEVDQLLTSAQHVAGGRLTDSNVRTSLAEALHSCGTTPLAVCLKNTILQSSDPGSNGNHLHTTSGACSTEVAGYLEGMEVRHCFGRLYGADMINTFKEGPEYYKRIFTDVGILPTEALVVDDCPHAIAWAAQTGARTVLISTSSSPENSVTLRIGSLAELPTFFTTEMREWKVPIPSALCLISSPKG